MSEDPTTPATSGLYRAQAVSKQFQRDAAAVLLDPSPIWTWAALVGGAGLLIALGVTLATTSIEQFAFVGGLVRTSGRGLHVSASLTAEAASSLRAGTPVQIIGTGNTVGGVVVSAMPGPAAACDCVAPNGGQSSPSGLDVEVSLMGRDVSERDTLRAGTAVKVRLPLGRRRLSEVLLEAMLPKSS